MRRPSLLLPLILMGIPACGTAPSDLGRWQARAQSVTIIRDDWGIAHVYGRSDADAVFGLIYAQAEDDFNRVEANYIDAMGRLAEAEGESAIWRDLRMKLFINPDSMRALYRGSPEWLRALMDAWADGLNFYLYQHPQVKPRVITRFEPWMALTFSEGSIGGDIESISLRSLEAFYGGKPADQLSAVPAALADQPTGSNGIAIAPANTTAGHALLLINPHTSFYFRAEAQVVSEEGLDAYGAITWGQFFIYQGFNDRLGWMHTSSGVDAIDEFAETVVQRGDTLFYRYAGEDHPMRVERISVPFRTDTGMARRDFTVYRTLHGPVVRGADGKWIAVSLMEEPVQALIESYSRTKARDYQAFKATVELNTNSSNNTVYADADGNIAYFHASFIPRRNPMLNWNRPVDGSDPATDWGDLLPFDDRPNLLNPATGWLQNTNNAPWSAAGSFSPKAREYPAYVDREGENPRGVHAIRLLQGRKDFTLQGLIDAAYDSYQPEFALLLPPLIQAWDRLPVRDPRKAKLAEPVNLLRNWDYRWSTVSVPTSVAVYWGNELWSRSAVPAREAGLSTYEFTEHRAGADDRLDALAAAVEQLETAFGSWRMPWGEINRFQRLTDDLVHQFNDSAPSIPVEFTSARWGSLASYDLRTRAGGSATKKRYGDYGNSFVAVVEFGDSVKARAVTAGGESGDPASPHFNDQAERYSNGNLRPVYYYRSQLEGHTERTYHPGEESGGDGTHR